MSEHADKKKTVFICLAVVLCGIYLVNSAILWGHIIDDAYISLRYAHNLATGNGLVYNPGEKVEGYTNFLWVIIAAFIIKAGGDPVTGVKITGVVCGLIIWFITLKWSRTWFGRYSYTALIPAAYIATNGCFIRYSLSGMETALYGLCLVLALFLVSGESGGKKSFTAMLCLLGAALVRPEGLLFVAVIFLYGGYRSFRGEGNRRSWILHTAIFCVLYLAYTVWRITYFGHLLPNTYYVRMGTGFSDHVYTWKNGLLYLTAFLRVHYFLPLLALGAIAALKKFKGIGIVWGFTFLFTVVVIAEGGDWMPFFRMFVPVLPLFFILLVALFRNRIIHLCLIILISISWWPVSSMANGFSGNRLISSFGHRYRAFKSLDKVMEKDIQLGQWIGDHSPRNLKLAVRSAGVVPYYSRLYTIDCLGITDAHIARTSLQKDKISSPGYPGKSGGKKMASIMPAHGKEDYGYVLSKKPDLFLEGDPKILKQAGYKQFTFPVMDRSYWAEKEIRWRQYPE